MVSRIRRWGNSLGLRIPKQLADEIHLAEGASVDLKAHNGRLIVTPLRREVHTLEELLAAVKRSNLHDEVDFGQPRGREAW